MVHQPDSGAPDGFTYFGCLPEVVEGDTEDMMPMQESQTNKQQQQYRVVNDFVIPNRNQETCEQHRGIHF